MPVGKRPTPKVASGRGSNRWSGPGISRDYNGTRGTKSPTGSRPVPSVPRNTPTPGRKPPGGRAGISPMPMPAPKRAANTGRSRRNGG